MPQNRHRIGDDLNHNVGTNLFHCGMWRKVDAVTQTSLTERPTEAGMIVGFRLGKIMEGSIQSVASRYSSWLYLLELVQNGAMERK